MQISTRRIKTKELKEHIYDSRTEGKQKESQEYCFSVQFISVTQLSPTPSNPMDCSTPGLPVHQQFPELTQTHLH